MTEPTTRHPDLETLAELDEQAELGELGEGLPDGTPAATRLYDHVRACGICAEEVARLRQVRSQLAELPAPPIPADVALRLDAALQGAQPVTRRRPHSRRWVPAGAAAAAIAVLVAAGIAALTARPSPSGSSRSAPASAAATPGSGVPATGRSYTRATLPADVRALLSPQTAAGNLAPTRSGVPRASTAQPLTDDRAEPRPPGSGWLTECVIGLAGERSQPPIAVDFARFDGQPAVVIVLPDPNPRMVQAWVVRPTCSRRDSKVLDHQQVGRSG